MISEIVGRLRVFLGRQVKSERTRDEKPILAIVAALLVRSRDHVGFIVAGNDASGMENKSHIPSLS